MLKNELKGEKKMRDIELWKRGKNRRKGRREKRFWTEGGREGNMEGY